MLVNFILSKAGLDIRDGRDTVAHFECPVSCLVLVIDTYLYEYALHMSPIRH